MNWNFGRMINLIWEVINFKLGAVVKQLCGKLIFLPICWNLSFPAPNKNAYLCLEPLLP